MPSMKDRLRELLGVESVAPSKSDVVNLSVLRNKVRGCDDFTENEREVLIEALGRLTNDKLS
ncbi:hypothetical protein [Bradyrhizobium sp. S3.7.6]